MLEVDKIQTKSSFKFWFFLFLNSLKSNFFVGKFLYWWVIKLSSFREKFWMVNVWGWMFHFSIGKLSRDDINDFIGNFSVQTVPELYDTFDFSMNSLVFTNINIFTWFPFEPSLSGDNISRINFFTTKFLQSTFLLWNITPVFYQQNLWFFVLMMPAFLKRWIELKWSMILLLCCLKVDWSCSLFLKNKLTFIFTQLLFYPDYYKTLISFFLSYFFTLNLLY